MCQTSYVAAGTFLPGRHLLFFLLQAPFVLLERQLLKRVTASNIAAAHSAQAPKQVAASQRALLHTSCSSSWQQVPSIVMTFIVLLVLAEWLFWPPLEACKSDVNGVAEIADGLAWLQRKVSATWAVVN